ncbi:MAG: hypothetical protein ACI9F9_001645 [Candidatus Paceibacteria bacterium]
MAAFDFSRARFKTLNISDARRACEGQKGQREEPFAHGTAV